MNSGLKILITGWFHIYRYILLVTISCLEWSNWMPFKMAAYVASVHSTARLVINVTVHLHILLHPHCFCNILIVFVTFTLLHSHSFCYIHTVFVTFTLFLLHSHSFCYVHIVCVTFTLVTSLSKFNFFQASFYHPKSRL